MELPCGFGRSGFRSEVSANLVDHHWVLDANDDPHCLATGRAGLEVEE
jgi:hypothetical protein